jgi:prepilin-type N-terminal cleavage/methylation domain-containing protein
MASRTRRGFTLIEMLIVVVIIGVVAAIAIPKFNNTKSKSNAATLRSDLRNIASAQEAYFFEHSAYASSPSLLKVNPSPGVIVTIVSATSAGWSAKVTHPQSYPLTCAVFSGKVSSLPAPATVEGLVTCE